ncbi:hypothetical protein IQ22_04336 [Pseudomonas duriflava]|uniref:O-antigen ligase-like membrane protein n=1 Tax=Pseudomonas duriflava TaxID=459528 RepID=A0A562PS54_9PSED|nr:hypothetical protein [Pseudomonas duriflava]TWI47272.1 hypothetical protein IQ22_04336 [Pseudomonas duriflava]
MNDTVSLPTYRLHYRPALSKASVMAWIATSLLIIETFSGALRYYSDIAGLAALLYLPKLACLAAIAWELGSFKTHKALWLTLMFLMVSSMVAMVHGASPGNIGFTVFIYLPLLFGLICGRHLEQRSAFLCKVVLLCLTASLIGLALDLFTSVPWKGYSYSLGDTELSANRAWAADSFDRPAGFARLSTALAMMIGLYALYLNAFLRSHLLKLTLFMVALYAIVLSTNKSTAAAFTLTSLMLLVSAYTLPSLIAYVLAVFMGIALPVIGLIVRFNVHLANAADNPLGSFYDRLINTWPVYIRFLYEEGWAYVGAGFGAVGGSGSAFPMDGLDVLGVSDNTALYVWATLGLPGLFLYTLWFFLLVRLRQLRTPLSYALLAATFCICLIGWATDIMEVTIATLFLGMAISHVLHRPAPGPIPVDGWLVSLRQSHQR